MLPSSHEGLPIALLEAMSYGLRCIASDIPANLEVPLPPDQFFPLGDVEALAALLTAAAEESWTAQDRAATVDLTAAYDWDRITAQTLEVYRTLGA